MKAALRQRARELGFDDCRFTTAAAPASAPHLQDWLTTGQHGEMAYLQRNAPKRVDPQLVLPGARSVICLAVSYHQDPSPQFSVLSPVTHHASRITASSPATPALRTTTRSWVNVSKL
jgi:epoxyqueuosine reductase QueG